MFDLQMKCNWHFDDRQQVLLFMFVKFWNRIKIPETMIRDSVHVEYNSQLGKHGFGTLKNLTGTSQNRNILLLRFKNEVDLNSYLLSKGNLSHGRTIIWFVCDLLFCLYFTIKRLKNLQNEPIGEFLGKKISTKYFGWWTIVLLNVFYNYMCMQMFWLMNPTKRGGKWENVHVSAYRTFFVFVKNAFKIDDWNLERTKTICSYHNKILQKRICNRMKEVDRVFLKLWTFYVLYVNCQQSLSNEYVQEQVSCMFGNDNVYIYVLHLNWNLNTSLWIKTLRKQNERVSKITLVRIYLSISWYSTFG